MVRQRPGSWQGYRVNTLFMSQCYEKCAGFEPVDSSAESLAAMLRDSELRQAAQLMIRRHGAGATIKAGFRAASLMDSGDSGAAAIWVEIISEINRIRAELRSAYTGLPLDPPVAEREAGSRVA